MPRVTLEFELPEEREDLETALKANKLHCAAWDFGEYLRRRFKHVDPESIGTEALYEEIRNKFNEEFEGLIE